MTQSLVSVDVGSIKELVALVGDEKKKSEDAPQKGVQGKNVQARREAWIEAVRSLDLDAIDYIDGLMSRYTAEVATVDDTPHELTEPEANDLMREALANKEITEFLAARYSAIRNLVFSSVSLTEEDEHRNGVVNAPEFDKAFAKEGCGDKPATLDEKKLKDLLGDAWDEVTSEEVVVTRKLDEDKLLAYLSAHPAEMEKVREATVSGGKKSPRFNIRAMKR